MTLVWCGVHRGWVPVVRLPGLRRRSVVAHHRVKTVTGIWAPCAYSRSLITYMDRTRQLPPTPLDVNRGLT